MNPSSCPFCDYKGPSRILAETRDVFVIEPMNPVTPGHVLVIPRRHVANAREDRRVTARVMEIASQWCATDHNLITSIGPDATQTVRHLHVHVVPRRAGDGLALPWSESHA